MGNNRERGGKFSYMLQWRRMIYSIILHMLIWKEELNRKVLRISRYTRNSHSFHPGLFTILVKA